MGESKLEIVKSLVSAPASLTPSIAMFSAAKLREVVAREPPIPTTLT